MNDAAVALIQKLPVWYLLLLIPFSVWVWSHIRTDKQGKKYWYSQKYEDDKRNRKQDDITKSLIRIDCANAAFAGNHETFMKRLDTMEETDKAQTKSLETMSQGMDKIGVEFARLHAQVDRIDLISAIHNAPQKVEVIMRMHDSYKKRGLNSYVDTVYNTWFEKYAKHEVEERIK